MRLLTAMLGLCLSSAVALGAGNSTYGHLYEGLPFEMPVIDKPSFPANTVTLTDFGAVSDGKTLNTDAFAAAIDALSAKGGGTLNVPSGIWLTGPIIFKSNINLHLEGGSLILFSPDPDLYPVIHTVYEGYEAYRAMSPIYGEGLENVAITGDGAIDGNGAAWRAVKRDKMTPEQWKRLVASGGIVKDDYAWYPGEDYIAGSRFTHDQLKALSREEAEQIKRFVRR